MTAGRRLLDDCFLHDRDRLTHAEALAILKARVGPVVAPQTVPLAEADGRILAAPVAAPRDVPAFDNAAVDGYAFSHSDLAETGGLLPVSLRIPAGHPVSHPLARGTAARIFTGAVIPDGADTVAMQEDCRLVETGNGPAIEIPTNLKQGSNRRRAGEDIAAGQALLHPGTRLRPQDLAAIASTGLADVSVYRRARVALVSTGDEIRRPGEPLPPGGVYDANHFLLRSLVATCGAASNDLGILPDRAGVVREKLAEAALAHDAILTTGGASRGEEDHLVTALASLGKRHIWQLAIKPGRPMSFGQIGDCVVLGLPGNPVAAMICFLLYARPVLSALGGGDFPEPRRFRLPAAFSVARKKPDRREFYRGTLVNHAQGGLAVAKFERDGSGLISSLRAADGLIELPEIATEVELGQPVDFIPFTELGLLPR